MRVFHAACLCVFVLLTTIARADTFTITADPAIHVEPLTGRLVVCFITEQGEVWDQRQPLDAPFFSHPQPIASWEITDWKPGETLTLDSADAVASQPLESIDGRVRLAAILDSDQTERAFTDGPGNLYSKTLDVAFKSGDPGVSGGGGEDHIELMLDQRSDGPEPPESRVNLEWVKLRSPMLTEFYGRKVYHRAGIALPASRYDEATKDEKLPAVYVIPGFGNRHTDAGRYATMLKHMDADKFPQAVFIVLDPESPLGHHGFVDSPANGPRQTALVEELIPYLEARHNLISQLEARIVTGHSSGGWSALWLALSRPDIFGACWASAPDPVDFTAFQMSNIYEDANLYVAADGTPQPSYRSRGDSEQMLVRMTVQQEQMMEYAIDPHGRSGQQWDAWEAMFSPVDSETGLPQPLIDSATGVINHNVAEAWRRCDIAHLVTSDWKRYGPILTERVRLICGEQDSFYLNRAVQQLKEKVDAMHGDGPGEGYIRLLGDEDHGSLAAEVMMPWFEEMRAHFAEYDLIDGEP